MSTFQEMLRQDIGSVFLNPEEFGEIHVVDGKEMVVILDDNELAERGNKVVTMAEGLHERRLLMYVSEEDFGPASISRFRTCLARAGCMRSVWRRTGHDY